MIINLYTAKRIYTSRPPSTHCQAMLACSEPNYLMFPSPHQQCHDALLVFLPRLCKIMSSKRSIITPIHHTICVYNNFAPEQVPHLGWHQLAAPQKSAPVPQKLLPLQHSPEPHLALTIGPQVSPAPTILGGVAGEVGGFLVREQSP